MLSIDELNELYLNASASAAGEQDISCAARNLLRAEIHVLQFQSALYLSGPGHCRESAAEQAVREAEAQRFSIRGDYVQTLLDKAQRDQHDYAAQKDQSNPSQPVGNAESNGM